MFGYKLHSFISLQTTTRQNSTNSPQLNMPLSNLSRSTDSWSTLPYVPLVSIFQILNYRDRFHASLVCRDWSVAFDCPTLWKEVELIFSGNMVEDSKKAVMFAKKHATSVKILKMDYLRNTEARLPEVLNRTQLLFEYLFSSKPQSFELHGFIRVHQASLQTLFQATATAFKAFMGQQTELQKLSVYNALFPENFGLEVLTELAKRNEILRELRLMHFFEESVEAYRSPIFQNVLKTISNLQALTVSYQCISNEIIEILCDNCEKSNFRNLSVLCSFREILHHRILNPSWWYLRRKFPHIVISFELVEVVTEQQFVSLVLPGTQLDTFIYKCGFTLETEQNLRIHGVSILRYLTHHFSNFLRNIHLDFGFVNIPSLERALLRLLWNCKRLNKISLSGVLQPVVAKRVCEMALRPESEITDLSLMFFFTTIDSMDDMTVLREHKRQLEEKGVNFNFNLLVS